MSDAMAAYFAAGRAAGLMLLVIGAVSAELAFTLWRKGSTGQARGAAAALALMASLQVGLGVLVQGQVPRHEVRVAALASTGQVAVRTAETPRIQALVDRFERYRWLCAGLLALGVALAVGGRSASVQRGFGLGLAPQAVLMWVLVSLGQMRAQAYLAWLMRAT